jgi:formylglycine-generating enzyme required for sulfatase activity
MVQRSEVSALVPELVLLPGGEFVMGKEGSTRKDEGPAHRVVLAPFQAAVAPVTNAEYAAYREATAAAEPPFVGDERFAAADAPVVGISWFEAVAYCEWLRRQTGIAFRLPTEAEREFAARGGLDGDWPWEGERHPLQEWLDGLDRPHAPREECANAYGLRCMAENVHEWCSDWYAADYYARSPAESPRGPETGVRRASRGGAWRHREKVTRVNARSSIPPEFRYSDYGFRVYADA